MAIGKYRKAEVGEISPRQVLILVEWESWESFQSYLDDPNLEDLHPHRINGTSEYIWHIYDKLEDLANYAYITSRKNRDKNRKHEKKE